MSSTSTWNPIDLRRGIRPREFDAGEKKSRKAMFILEVLSGPLDGKTWTFEGEITIGRDETLAGACITLDRYISRRHARLREDGERLMLTDLESRNGTKVGGRLLTSEVPIGPGERFVVGRTLLRVSRA
ncbi:MAG: FHA domain-containing protein [Candidatus Baltobacteraceae bacterium]